MSTQTVTAPVFKDSTAQSMLTALNTIAQNVTLAASTKRYVPLNITVEDWEESNDVYIAEYETEYVTETSRENVVMDGSFLLNASSSIKVNKMTGGGGIVLETDAIPTGSLTGMLEILDTDDGQVPVVLQDTVIPIENGGTGASNLSGAQDNLGISALADHLAQKINGELYSGYNRFAVLGNNSGIFIFRSYLDSGTSNYLQLICNAQNKTMALSLSTNGTESELFHVNGV